MRKTARLGVIGTGAIGTMHLQASRDCRRMEISAICDLVEPRARARAEEFGVPRVYTDYRKLLADDAVDAVLVCTPNNTHLPITTAACKAGKHVMCEKPIAMDSRQAASMVRAAEQAGVILMAAQSFRYGASSRFLKERADRGRFGDIYYAKTVWLRRSGIPRGWFQDAKQSGGGPTIDLGVHAVDLMWWVMGQPEPVSAYGVAFDHLGTTGQGMGDWGIGYNPGKFSVEDMVAGTVRFADGRALGIDISWAAHSDEMILVRFFGTKAGAQLSPKLVLYGTEDGVHIDSTPALSRGDAYAAEIQHFVDCVRRGREPLSPGSQAVVVMKMLDAIVKSARTGRMASIRTG
jgi:predicted dehydrogenase